MSDELNAAIIGGLVGAAAAGPIAYVLTRLQRGRDGKDRFLAAIAELEADFPGPSLGLERFYHTSLPKLRQAIFTVQPFVDSVRFARLRKCLREYERRGTEQKNWQASGIQIAIGDMLQSQPTALGQSGPDEWMPEFYSKFRDVIG